MIAGVVVLVASVVSCVAAVLAVVAVTVLVMQVRRLETTVEVLRRDALAAAADARTAAGLASTEMARVEAVLEDAGSVTATVDATSRLASRALANPVVKLLAVRAGASRGLHELRRPTPATPAPPVAGNGHRPTSRPGRRR